MMTIDFHRATHSFETLIDFFRFGLSCANTSALHYGHGTDNSWDDIRALVLGTLKLPYDLDPQMWNARLSLDEKDDLAEQLHQRINHRVPVPYLTHEANFCGLPFYVDERVLIPRSPIAELIQQQFTPWIDPDNVRQILDLCTGSACIAIACCDAFPDALVDAVDISADALMVAEINRVDHQVEDALTLIESDGFSNLSPHHQYDIIVSNPPYVGYDEMQTLPCEYQHEPALALEAENNGLALVVKILHQAHDYLTDQGILVVEVGNSEHALMELYPDVPFTWLDFEQGGHGVFLLTRDQLVSYFNQK